PLFRPASLAVRALHLSCPARRSADLCLPGGQDRRQHGGGRGERRSCLSQRRTTRRASRYRCDSAHTVRLIHVDWWPTDPFRVRPDRKSTRLNTSHVSISYDVLCWKKK